MSFAVRLRSCRWPSMLRVVVKLQDISDESPFWSSVPAAEQTAHPSAVRAGGRRTIRLLRAWASGRTRRSAVRHEAMLALPFYPSSRSRRGPLRLSSLEPNTTAAVPSPCRSPPGAPATNRTRSTRADASAIYAAFNTAPTGSTPVVAYRHRAIKSLRARATLPTRRARFPRPKRS
jgi:hypothetical protein